MPPPGDHRHLNFGDTVAVVALVIALIAWTLIPSIYAKIGAVAVAALLLIYLSHRSHFSRKWTPLRKRWVAIVMVTVLAVAASAQLIPQWRGDQMLDAKDISSTPPAGIKPCPGVSMHNVRSNNTNIGIRITGNEQDCLDGVDINNSGVGIEHRLQ